MEQWDTWLANDIFVCNKIKNENNTTNKLSENISNLNNTQEINKSDETITTPLWSPKIVFYF